ncbi:uncharacterized protein LOC129589193 isoform X2 [Paramacrobiotus metropolitanus]|uniref:uncharacterized protein LOC129589193 isoform X2 n=1 Tax=Paramacrobiotus metropolitanus TaxID=2943436 RepID=UPI002445B0E0|nr:uncharacterized protein LOC129589193 isoform X2 [Paramacrobiotus metropolitanus]
MSAPGINKRNTLILGCSGSVACIKIPEIVDLIRACFPRLEIVVIPTTHASHFLPKDGNGRVCLFSQQDRVQILDPCQSNTNFAGLMETVVAFLIAPLGANLMAKLANPSFLQSANPSNLELAVVRFLLHRQETPVPFLLAAAMNSMMWNSVVTENNLREIRSLYGSGRNCVVFIPTVDKPSMCGETGFGPMASPPDIVEYLQNTFIGSTVSDRRDIIVVPVPKNYDFTGKMSILDEGWSSQKACSHDAFNYRFDLCDLVTRESLNVLLSADIESSLQLAVNSPEKFECDTKQRFVDAFMADLRKCSMQCQHSDNGEIQSVEKQVPRYNIKYITSDSVQKLSPEVRQVDQTVLDQQSFSDWDEWQVWSKREDPVLHILLRQWADILTCVIRAWDYSRDTIFLCFTKASHDPLKGHSQQQLRELQQRGIRVVWM